MKNILYVTVPELFEGDKLGEFIFLPAMKDILYVTVPELVEGDNLVEFIFLPAMKNILYVTVPELVEGRKKYQLFIPGYVIELRSIT